MSLKRIYDDLAQGSAFRLLQTVVIFLLFPRALVVVALPGPPNENPKVVHYDGADWHLKGKGIVCCPCKVPCPCRNNSQPSYGHCEATRYLKVREGKYGSVDLSGMQVVDSGGMCAISYHKRAALYFDRSSTPAQQAAYMKLIASFSAEQAAEFPHVRIVPISAQIAGDHLFTILIPGTLAMVVDRNWGQATAPMPEVAAPDQFSNTIQYAQNIRYWMHDETTNIDFDYSRRQANYRSVDLSVQQYRSQSMLIQFLDGAGWFNAEQMAIIRLQRLKLPQLDTIRQEALRLQEARGN
jgi:hypothetical protein